MNEKIETLNRDFGNGESVRFVAEHKDFPSLWIRNRFAEAKIALQGAHLYHFARHGEAPLLWLSETAIFKTGKAIRGGVPVCWPWFGPHPHDTALPNHGFARTAEWDVVRVEERSDGATEAVFRLHDTQKSRSLWPYRFRLTLKMIIAEALTLELTTENRDREAFEIGSALHTYFNVSEIEKISVSGLERVRYFDQLDQKYKLQSGPVRFCEETDRIYLKPPDVITLEDAHRSVRIVQKGSRSAVIWNPWAQKSKSFADMQNDAYKKMVCIETANALEDIRILASGESHTLGFEIT